MIEFTVEDLAEFTGRDTFEYSDFAATALQQAWLLFRLATCRDDLPDSGPLADLAKYAILAMAENLSQAQKYADVYDSPYQSQSIGSYSYSVGAQAIADGKTTGVPWFDMAVKELSVCHLKDDGFGTDIPMFGGIDVYDSYGETAATGQPNVYRHLTAADYERSASWGFHIPNGGN